MQHSPGFLKLVESVQQGIKEVDAEKVWEMLKSQKDFAFVDVREESEWANGRLPQATHISKGIIERDIESKIPDKNKEIVLYCGGGFRSALAAHNLQLMGYTHVYSMSGGYRDWIEKKFPVEAKKS